MSSLAGLGCGSSKDAGGTSRPSRPSDGDDDGDDSDESPSDAGVRRDAGRDAGRDASRPLPDAALPPGWESDVVDFHKDATGTAGLTPSVLDDLKKGGKSCSAKILYPYEDTIFPAGLLPPTIMWEGASEAAHLRLAYEGDESVDYQVAGGATQKGELSIPQDDWREITRRTRGRPLLLTLSTKTASGVSTCKSKWKIAEGVMSGSVFFNTYNSPDKLGMGAVMRLRLGAPKTEVYLSYNGFPPAALAGPCVSCHSVAAGGSTIAASTHNYNPFTQFFEGASYDVTTSTEPKQVAKLLESTFGALTPDGTRMLRMGNPDCTAGSNAFPRSPNNFMLLVGPTKTELVDTRTGRTLPAKGLRQDWYMWMPQFSPRGDKVVFNHARPGPNGTIRRDLAMMDFDDSTNTFSNLRMLVSNQGVDPSLPYSPLPVLGASISPLGAGAGGCTQKTASDVGAIPKGSCSGPCYPAWPFFTPDGEGVIYSLISQPDFAVAIPGREAPSKSELWYLPLAAGAKPIRLDRANQGLAQGDSLANYYPTVLPVQVGGYYWVFWTSTRRFGHREFGIGLESIANSIFNGSSALSSVKKRIWVTALRPDDRFEGGKVAQTTDPSAPAFYLEGQSETGNVRAFAALNACLPMGETCTSGLDCCTGFCRIAPSASEGSCVEQQSCAELNERCKTDDDCCPAADGQPRRQCIGNYCGFQVPVL